MYTKSFYYIYHIIQLNMIKTKYTNKQKEISKKTYTLIKNRQTLKHYPKHKSHKKYKFIYDKNDYCSLTQLCKPETVKGLCQKEPPNSS